MERVNSLIVYICFFVEQLGYNIAYFSEKVNATLGLEIIKTPYYVRGFYYLITPASLRVLYAPFFWIVRSPFVETVRVTVLSISGT